MKYRHNITGDEIDVSGAEEIERFDADPNYGAVDEDAVASDPKPDLVAWPEAYDSEAAADHPVPPGDVEDLDEKPAEPTDEELAEIPQGDLGAKVEWVAAAPDQDEARRRADLVWAQAGDVAGDELAGRLQTAVYGAGSALPEDPVDPGGDLSGAPAAEVLTEHSGDAEEPVELKGQALDDALEEAGLPKTGTADEKRERLAAHQAEQNQA